MENPLSAYQELLGRLNRSKTKQRQGNNGGRSAPAREAEYQKSQLEYRANQDRYRGDFEIKGGFDPRNAYQQILVGYYNPETGATWSAPNPGYTPKEGTGWVKGYGPKSDKPISSLKEKTPTTSSNPALTKTMLNRMGNF